MAAAVWLLHSLVVLWTSTFNETYFLELLYLYADIQIDYIDKNKC